MICMMSSPALSSVAIPAERIGYEAAAILDGMLSGKMPPREPLLLPAKEVVGRQSSDTLAIHDPELAAAVRYIRQHAGDRISVEDVVKMSKLCAAESGAEIPGGIGAKSAGGDSPSALGSGAGTFDEYRFGDAGDCEAERVRFGGAVDDGVP